jgi:RNA polymerase sigma-70 factor (ECF subfamily)
MTVLTDCVNLYFSPFGGHGTRAERYGLTVRSEFPSESPDFLPRLRAGDPKAFEDMVKIYQHRIHGVAFRVMGSWADAEEVAQETFLRVHRALADFRGDARLSTWLYAIASRLCLNRLASGEHKMARRRVEEDMAGLVWDEPGGNLEQTEREAAVHRALAELPEERRVVIVLRDFEGLSYDEIAAALGLELGTVRSRLHRARLDLKGKLERYLT